MITLLQRHILLSEMYPYITIGDKRYKIKKIGSLIWMTENLAYENGDFKYPGNSTNNKDIYGLLYTGIAAELYVPSGWRIPSVVDFKSLESLNGIGTPNAASAIKSSDPLVWSNPAFAGTNITGFNALPSGNDSGSLGACCFIHSSDYTDINVKSAILLNPFAPFVYIPAPLTTVYYSIRYCRDI